MPALFWITSLLLSMYVIQGNRKKKKKLCLISTGSWSTHICSFLITVNKQTTVHSRFQSVYLQCSHRNAEMTNSQKWRSWDRQGFCVFWSIIWDMLAKRWSSFVPACQQQNVVWGRSAPAGKAAGTPMTAEDCKSMWGEWHLGPERQLLLYSYSKKGQSWSVLQHAVRSTHQATGETLSHHPISNNLRYRVKIWLPEISRKACDW